MKSLRFTVYELLGYFAPGGVVFLAVLVFGWAVFFPTASIKIADISFKKETWVFILAVSYTLGHVIQGICNFHISGERMFERKDNNKDLVRNARIALESRCGIATSSYSCSKLAGLCQTLILHVGKMDDHDVFLYREGYYRGSSAAFLLLAIALVIRAVRLGATLTINEQKILIVSGLWLFLIVLSAASSVVFYFRFRRFALYRVANLLNFACLPKKLLLSASASELADSSNEGKSEATDTEG
jgi:hypothetical protein